MERPKLNYQTKIWNSVNVQATYTQFPFPMEKNRDSTVFTASDWATARSSLDFYSTPTQSAFIELYHSVDHQIKAALHLMQVIDLTSFNCIGEIGGVPFRQLITILNSNPQLRSLATDFDHNSLSIFSRELSNFRNSGANNNNKLPFIEFARISEQVVFKNFDLTRENLDLFMDCDIIMMWGVDYGLGDSELRKLLEFIKVNGITLIVGTLTPIRTSTLLMEKLKTSSILRKLFRKNKIKLRLHGYFRTSRYFKKLASELELNSTTIFTTNWYTVLEIK